jgi:hypothetical protein
MIHGLISASGAPLPSHAPSLTVHETAFGTVTQEDHREDIQELSIRIVSHAEPGTAYEIQCFFLKQGKHGTSPCVDDTVTFDVVNPHGSYKVMAKPIKLKGASLSSKAGKSKKPSSKSPSAAPINDSPRFGYLVRILSHGEVLRERFSNHSVENFIKENPGLLEAAIARKSVRRLDAGNLVHH